MNTTLQRLCLLLFPMFVLAGCGGILNPGPAPTRLQLRPIMPAQIAATPTQQQIVVGLPSAGRDLDTDQIALIFGRREVRYLADARWTAQTPSLLQRSYIDALTSSGVFRGVSDESAGISAGTKLISTVRGFGLHYEREGAVPTAEFEASFQLLNLNDGSIMASMTVRTTAAAAGTSPAALAGACEDALSQGLAKLAPWVAENAAKRKK